ncbi:MAG: dihydroorotate dehydrogenase electron transfer subunit [archaeon]|nr:dihydroorotate dehydrogenase electron transfer subunit [archaeon]MCP8306841.1 dihydroorotate dehydrogenase electron transfer subunit [archaeon]
MVSDKPRIVKVLDVREESQTVRSLIFEDDPCSKAKPGQFVMVWILGVDEIPMSISMTKADGLAGFTVRKVGEASAALFDMKVGSLLGVRGPYGKHFTNIIGDVMIVGAGTGLAPLMPLSEVLTQNLSSIYMIIGGKTIDEFVFVDRARATLSKTKSEIIITTEDGSYGTKGLATDAMEPILKERQIDMIYTCGPELMIKKVLEIAQEFSVPIQASLERIMKCGIGICGSCCIGRYRVCKDGPVFDSPKLEEIIDELGSFKRDHSGRVAMI